MEDCRGTSTDPETKNHSGMIYENTFNLLIGIKKLLYSYQMYIFAFFTFITLYLSTEALKILFSNESFIFVFFSFILFLLKFIFVRWEISLFISSTELSRAVEGLISAFWYFFTLWYDPKFLLLSFSVWLFLQGNIVLGIKDYIYLNSYGSP